MLLALDHHFLGLSGLRELFWVSCDRREPFWGNFGRRGPSWGILEVVGTVRLNLLVFDLRVWPFSVFRLLIFVVTVSVIFAFTVAVLIGLRFARL